MKKELTKKAGQTGSTKVIGRPRVAIAPEVVLNVYGQYRSINAAARILGITTGTCWARLKEAGITPLGMTPSQAGRFGWKCKQIERESYPLDNLTTRKGAARNA